jgi:hypothetical protein
MCQGVKECSAVRDRDGISLIQRPSAATELSKNLNTD